MCERIILKQAWGLCNSRVKMNFLCTVFICILLPCNILLNATTSSIFWPIGPKESISTRTLSRNSDSSTLDSESEVHAVTTVSPVYIPNHQPVFKSLLLHDHLLTRDFRGDQHFFRSDGSVAAYSTMPGSVSASDARDPVTQLVPHEDAPAFSDFATTATVAATSPLTTFSPITPRPPMSLYQKQSSKDRTRGEDKVEPTTSPLTTQVTLNNRGLSGGNVPLASVSSQKGLPQSWSATPEEGSPAPSSVGMDKGEAREAAEKDKTSSGHSPPNPTSGTTTMSTTITTNTPITTMQTAGRPVHVFLAFSEHKVHTPFWQK